MRYVSTYEKANYLELLLNAYFNADDESVREKDELQTHLDLLQMTKDFVSIWKKNGLPTCKMNDAFRQTEIREIILCRLPISEDFLNTLFETYPKDYLNNIIKRT